MTDSSDSQNPTGNPNADSQSQTLASPQSQGSISTDPNTHSGSDQKTSEELAREFRWVEISQVIINGALAIIGIIALCIYGGQLKVMRGQLGEIIRQYPDLQKSAQGAKDGAEAAARAVTASEKHFRVEQRPYVVVRPPDIPDMGQFGMGGSGFVTSHLENIGHSVAFNTRFLPVVDIIDQDTVIHSFDDLAAPIDQAFQKDVIERMKQEERRGFKHPKRDMAPGLPSELGGHLARPATTRNMFGILTGNSFALFMGTVHYSAFGSEEHVTEFCWFMSKPIQIPAVEPSKSPTYNYAWFLCKDHNTIH